MIFLSSERSHTIARASKREEYLAKAKEAEEQAEKAGDESNKAAWLRIAAGYRDLASHQRRQS